MLVVAIIALQGPSGHSVKAGSRVPGGTVAPSGAGRGGTGHAGSSAGSGHASAHESHPPSGSASSPAAAREPLVVLNNTTITGLAERASKTFEAGGWTVTKYSNYQNDILSTCAYYDPDVAGARAAAEALRRQFPGIRRVKAQFSELGVWNSPIVVILTPDWASS